jgi:hypothetical protein
VIANAFFVQRLESVAAIQKTRIQFLGKLVDLRQRRHMADEFFPHRNAYDHYGDRFASRIVGDLLNEPQLPLFERVVG